MVKFIDDEKEKYGVEPICRILPIAPSTYYRIKDEQDNPEKQCRRKLMYAEKNGQKYLVN